MIPISLRLTNFGPHKDTKVSFEGIHAAVITGPNEAGKSVFAIDAITWALYGVARRSADEMICQGQLECAVAFEFYQDDRVYKVVRRRKRPNPGGRDGTSMLEFYVDGQPLHGDKIADTQAKIIDVLGLTYETAINSNFILQGKADEFTKKTPGERKGVLYDILPLAVYEPWWRQSKDKADALKARVQDAKRDLERIEAAALPRLQLETDLRDLLEQLESLERDRDTIEAHVQQAQADVNALQGKALLLHEAEARQGELATKLRDIDRQFQVCQAQQREVEKLTAGATEIEDGYHRLQEAQERNYALTEKQVRWQSLWAEKERVQTRMDKERRELEDQATHAEQRIAILTPVAHAVGECELCGQDLRGTPKAHAATEEIARLQSEADNALHSLATYDYFELDQKAEALEALSYDAEEHFATRKLITELSPYAERWAALQSAQTQLEKAMGEKERFFAEGERQQGELEVIWRTIETLQRETALLPQLQGTLAAFQSQLREAGRAHTEVTLRRGATEKALALAVDAEKMRHSAQVDLARLIYEWELYETLTLAFGKKGIPALIIDAAIPEIEAEANLLLAKMTGDRMHLTLETQRETKQKGEAVETLDIHISDELGTKAYEMYSGGAKFRIDLALRIALSRILARRAGKPLSFLVIDEGFGSQDAQGRAGILEALAGIREQFKMILVITHLEDMQDSFPVEIRVSKGNDGSKVEVLRC